MTSSINVAQLLTEATRQQRVWVEIERIIDPMDPEAQLDAMQSEGVIQSIDSLWTLQKNIETVFSRMQDLDPTIVEVLGPLSKAVTILEGLEYNRKFCWQFVDILNRANDPLQVTQTSGSQELRPLQERITQLAREYQNLNSGNATALAAALVNISILPGQFNPPLTRQRNDESTPTQIREEQDRAFQESSTHDQFKDLQEEFAGLSYQFTQNPAQDFEKVLAYYKTLQVFSFGKTKYTFPNAVQEIDSLLKDTETLLSSIITTQKNQESSQPQTALSPAIQQLKDRIGQFIQAMGANNSDDMANINRQIQPTFNALNNDEKKLFLEALNEILIRDKKIDEPLPESIMTLKLALWGVLKNATWDDKKEALEKMLGASSQHTQSTANNNTSLEMERRLQETINTQPPAITTTVRAQSIPPAPPTIRSSSGVEIIPSDDPLPPAPFMAEINTLKSILPLLENESVLDLQAAYEILFLLDAEGSKCLFKLNDNDEASIAGRAYFHLYWIHKDEALYHLRDDMEYGNKSWSGVFEGAINSERARTIQRTIVEVALQGLDDAVNFQDGASVIQYLRILEETKLDPKDRINGQDCIAYTLFQIFYDLHVAASKTNAFLVDPGSPEFRGDFGRNGFRTSKEGIDPALKLESITTVIEALKTAWKMQ